MKVRHHRSTRRYSHIDQGLWSPTAALPTQQQQKLLWSLQPSWIIFCPGGSKTSTMLRQSSWHTTILLHVAHVHMSRVTHSPSSGDSEQPVFLGQGNAHIHSAVSLEQRFNIPPPFQQTLWLLILIFMFKTNRLQLQSSLSLIKPTRSGPRNGGELLPHFK